MTFEETKALLNDLRAARRRVNVIKARIAELESDFDSIKSSLGGRGMSSRGGLTENRTDKLVDKVLQERDKCAQALERYFELEDKIADALDSMTSDEREVIIEFYISGFPTWKIAGNINCDERTVRRRKSAAIYKISAKI